MPERWLPNPRYPGRYDVSTDGRVRGVRRVLKRQFNPDGYPQHTLRDADGRNHIEPVHRLVMETFAGPRPLDADGKPMEILHRNGKRDDCRRRNLRYGTKPENRADREEHKRAKAGRGTVEQKGKQRETDELDGTRFLSRISAVKTCVKCGLTKRLAEFNRCSRLPDGYRNECRACQAAYYREYISSRKVAS